MLPICLGVVNVITVIIVSDICRMAHSYRAFTHKLWHLTDPMTACNVCVILQMEK